MKAFYKPIQKALAILLVGLVAGAPFAAAGNVGDYTVGISEKFGRGFVNLLGSPLEIPCTMGKEVAERGALGFGTGLFKGVVFFFRRFLVGATEIGTFMIPMEATLPAICASGPEAKVEPQAS